MPLTLVSPLATLARETLMQASGQTTAHEAQPEQASSLQGSANVYPL